MGANRPLDSHHNDLVELTRVQPFEAEVIAARLRGSGIEATLGVGSVYESVNFAEGVPVFVAAEDTARAADLLNRQSGSQETEMTVVLRWQPDRESGDPRLTLQLEDGEGRKWDPVANVPPITGFLPAGWPRSGTLTFKRTSRNAGP